MYSLFASVMCRINTRVFLSILVAFLGFGVGVSRAVVVVNFSQEGANVRAAWSGTLSINLLDSNTSTSDFDTFSNSGFLVRTSSSPYYQQNNVGASGSTFIPLSYTDADDLSFVPETTSFGFFTNSFVWSAVHVTGGIVSSNVSELTFVPTRDFYVFENTTLAAIGVSGLTTPTTAWITNNSDTVQYFVVPEPSSCVLLTLGLAALAGYGRKLRAASQSRG